MVNRPELASARMIGRKGRRAVSHSTPRPVGLRNSKEIRRQDQYGIASIGLWAKHDESDVAELLQKMYRSLEGDFIPLFEELVALEGRRFRPPFTVHDFAVAITALTEGFTLRWNVDDAAVSTDLSDVPRLLGEDRGSC